MYYYEDYMVKETPTAFIVSEVFDERTLRIEKSVVKKINSNQEEEIVAILLAKIELIRLENAKMDKRGPRTLLKKESFQQKMKVLIERTPVENLIWEISEMKFFELKERFLEEDDFFQEDEEDGD